MKKIIAMILVLLLTLTVLVACKKDDTPDVGLDNNPSADTGTDDKKDTETGINHDSVQGIENATQYTANGVDTPMVGFGD